MAMTQRDNAIEEIKRLDMLLECAVWSQGEHLALLPVLDTGGAGTGAMKK